jgi:hypothetical protein
MTHAFTRVIQYSKPNTFYLITLLNAKQITHGEIHNKQQNYSHNFVVFSSVFIETDPCTGCIFQRVCLLVVTQVPYRG